MVHLEHIIHPLWLITYSCYLCSILYTPPGLCLVWDALHNMKTLPAMYVFSFRTKMIEKLGRDSRDIVSREFIRLYLERAQSLRYWASKPWHANWPCCNLAKSIFIAQQSLRSHGAKYPEHTKNRNWCLGGPNREIKLYNSGGLIWVWFHKIYCSQWGDVRFSGKLVELRLNVTVIKEVFMHRTRSPQMKSAFFNGQNRTKVKTISCIISICVILCSWPTLSSLLFAFYLILLNWRRIRHPLSGIFSLIPNLLICVCPLYVSYSSLLVFLLLYGNN